MDESVNNMGIAEDINYSFFEKVGDKMKKVLLIGNRSDEIEKLNEII